MELKVVKMMCSIGKSRKGFTLIEVMISVIILSVGLLAVISAFINSLSVLNASQNRIKVVRFLNQKLSDIEIKSLEKGVTDEVDRGKFEFRGREFQWSLEVVPIQEPIYLSEDLSQVSLIVSWFENKNPKDVSVVTYLPKKKE